MVPPIDPAWERFVTMVDHVLWGIVVAMLLISVMYYLVKHWKHLWVWPLKGVTPMMPDAPGRFGMVRTHDIHTGVDLYCELGTEVVAVESGVVRAVEDFTGYSAGSPWWNHTQSVAVEGQSGVVVYGEVTPKVNVGERVKQGQVIAVVEKPVLREFKGRPMVMLHLELLKPNQTQAPWWQHGSKRPEGLLDPTAHLKLCEPSHTTFDMATYDGEKYRPKEVGHDQ